VIRALAFLYALLLVLVTITPVWAIEQVDDQGAQIVGVAEAPPFAMKDGNGNWDGIAVRLWRQVASDLGLQYELREMSIPDLIAAIEEGKLTAVVTAVVTAEWERLMDFRAIPTTAPASASPYQKHPPHPMRSPLSATSSHGRFSRSSACWSWC
jgi:ABC-type amino acid transport substrate-binding protein